MNTAHHAQLALRLDDGPTPPERLCGPPRESWDGPSVDLYRGSYQWKTAIKLLLHRLDALPVATQRRWRDAALDAVTHVAALDGVIAERSHSTRTDARHILWCADNPSMSLLAALGRHFRAAVLAGYVEVDATPRCACEVVVNDTRYALATCDRRPAVSTAA